VRSAVVASLALLVATAAPVAAETIKEIVVEENTKTDSNTVALIANIDVGDEWTPDMADKVKSDLITSGLFKDVIVFWESIEGGVRVHLLVKDKHSWVIAPAFYNQPTNTGGGIGFGENNLFGYNQKLLIYGQVATGDSFFVAAWVIPAIAGSRFSAQFDTFLKSSRIYEFASPTEFIGEGADPKRVRESRMHYLNVGGRLGVELWRGVRIDTRLRAAHVKFLRAPDKLKLAEGATIEDITGDPTSDSSVIPRPGIDGADISNEWALTVDKRANFYGIQSGYSLRFSFEHAVEKLGSDFSYWMVGAQAFKAKKILERHNLIGRLAFNLGHTLPFQQEFTSGGPAMRGYINSQFRGDFRVASTVEYSVPIFTVKGLSVRGQAFWDSAYTTFLTDPEDNIQRNYLPDSQPRGLTPWKNSVGVGGRLYLRQIVLPLLGVDFGYGLEAGDTQIYLAIGLTD